jgi:flagellar protein FlaJ
MESRFVYYGKYLAVSIVITSLLYALLYTTIFLPLIILPPLIILAVASQVRRKAISGHETIFIAFLNDLRDLLQGGMPLVTSLEIVSKNDYGKTKPYIARLAAQAKLGVDFEKALKIAFADIDSAIIKKSIYVISETHRRGGNLIKVFTATAKYITEIERLRTQRKSMTYASMFSSYIMFFIFLGIIIAIQAFFLPLLGQTTVFQTTLAQERIDFKTYFLFLLIVQSMFSGPMIGKISENSLSAGLRHSLILLGVSLPVYIIASAWLIPS